MWYYRRGVCRGTDADLLTTSQVRLHWRYKAFRNTTHRDESQVSDWRPDNFVCKHGSFYTTSWHCNGWIRSSARLHALHPNPLQAEEKRTKRQHGCVSLLAIRMQLLRCVSARTDFSWVCVSTCVSKAVYILPYFFLGFRWAETDCRADTWVVRGDDDDDGDGVF